MINLMNRCNNYFEKTAEQGDFTISCNAIEVQDTYKVGQYIRVMDSYLNDGVYKVTAIDDQTITLDADLTDETFTGYIVGLVVPNAFITLVSNIANADTHRGESSESIPNYSVSFINENVYTTYGSEISNYNKANQGRYYFLNWVTEYVG